MNEPDTDPANREPDAEPDFADEHDQTSVTEDDGRDKGETESPEGHGGLEPTKRPN